MAKNMFQPLPDLNHTFAPNETYVTMKACHFEPSSSRASPIPAFKSLEPSGEGEDAGEEAMEEEAEKEEEEGEGVDPTLLGDLHHTVSINSEQQL